MLKTVALQLFNNSFCAICSTLRKRCCHAWKTPQLQDHRVLSWALLCVSRCICQPFSKESQLFTFQLLQILVDVSIMWFKVWTVFYLLFPPQAMLNRSVINNSNAPHETCMPKIRRPVGRHDLVSAICAKCCYLFCCSCTESPFKME